MHLFSALKPPYLATTWRVAMMVTGAQGSSYALTTFLPLYLKTERHLTSVGTGSYLMVLILGAFFGFLSGAYLADGIGRKATFMVSAIGSVVLMLVYLFAPLSNDLILPVGFLLGYINLMMFSPMGPFMTELFPTAVRGVGQGFCYNVGPRYRRGVSGHGGLSGRAPGPGRRDRHFHLRWPGAYDRCVAAAARNQGAVAGKPRTPAGGVAPYRPHSRKRAAITVWLANGNAYVAFHLGPCSNGAGP